MLRRVNKRCFGTNEYAIQSVSKNQLEHVVQKTLNKRNVNTEKF